MRMRRIDENSTKIGGKGGENIVNTDNKSVFIENVGYGGLRV